MKLLRWKALLREDPMLCTQCGGLCCKSYPGMYLDPFQFVQAWELEGKDWRLGEVLENCYLSLKVCMGIPIPLPRFSAGGCIFLRKDGCTLPRHKRPLECLLMIPRVETLLGGEIRCGFPQGLDYLECFDRWREFYQERGIWKEALLIAKTWTSPKNPFLVKVWRSES